MIEPFFWIIWSAWMLLALGAACNVWTYLWRADHKDRRWRALADQRESESVALIIAVKGFDDGHSPHFFESMMTQDYSDYRLIFTVESETDPCVPWIRAIQAALKDGPSGVSSIDLVVAGPCEPHACGQKVHNQRVAFGTLTDRDRIVAFADADIRVDERWLRRLVLPLNAGTHPVTTTYRWLVPEGGLPWANAVASAMNGSVATMGGSELWNMTWGGSMAVTRDSFDEMDVPKLFEGSLNDDLRLAKHARAHRQSIAYVQSLLIASPVSYDWTRLIEFVRRQYYQVRHFAPLMYVVSRVLLSLYPLGLFATAIGWLGFGIPFGWVPLVVVTVLDQIRALGRARVARALFASEIHRRLRRSLCLEHLATPVWMTFHAILAISARWMRRITWAGITYRVVSPHQTEILNRQTLR